MDWGRWRSKQKFDIIFHQFSNNSCVKDFCFKITNEKLLISLIINFYFFAAIWKQKQVCNCGREHPVTRGYTGVDVRWRRYGECPQGEKPIMEELRPYGAHQTIGRKDRGEERNGVEAAAKKKQGWWSLTDETEAIKKNKGNSCR